MSDQQRRPAEVEDVSRLLVLHQRLLGDESNESIRMAFEEVLSSVVAAVAVASMVRRTSIKR